MTRINSDLDPKRLKRMHLVAELREITMVPCVEVYKQEKQMTFRKTFQKTLH